MFRDADEIVFAADRAVERVVGVTVARAERNLSIRNRVAGNPLNRLYQAPCDQIGTAIGVDGWRLGD